MTKEGLVTKAGKPPPFAVAIAVAWSNDNWQLY